MKDKDYEDINAIIAAARHERDEEFGKLVAGGIGKLRHFFHALLSGEHGAAAKRQAADVACLSRFTATGIEPSQTLLLH
ncbi:MAG: hypothetical protein M5R42_01205 [Rhodocyclaceae bacterium]|nr:hypothetical protein [Rhodocyclaceae bacterium]